MASTFDKRTLRPHPLRHTLTRRQAIAGIGAAVTGLALPDWSDDYFPRPEAYGGWRRGEPRTLGMNADLLREAVKYHDESIVTTSHGGALLIIYKGYLVSESYITGTEGGPQPWTASTCNDMKSSTASIFGTAVGVFLNQFPKVTLETPLVGASRKESLIPQIWDQPITDPRKMQIKIKHALSMTSGHETGEPWLAPGRRVLSDGYGASYQMYEYCFGWWQFENVPGQHALRFDPGSTFYYSSFGLEQVALAMRNLTKQEVGPYLYDRVLGPIGLPRSLRDNQYLEMPYTDSRELNFDTSAGWGRGGSDGCNAYGADGSFSAIGYNTIAGSTFRCTARDFARLAYLWLKKGRWGQRQLVPAAWLELATRRFVRENGDTPNNYGYTFWTHRGEPGVPEDIFMSLGHNLNNSYVIPSLDLVVVRQGNDNRRVPGNTPFTTALIQKIVAAIA
jgi:CubicO group peptidase (beta-lactamase class C family)